MSYDWRYGSTSNEYDDNSNNPYHAGEHGGTSTASSARPSNTSSSNWFCHACQADFTLTDEQLARSGTATCPQCNGEFVEQTGESIDDPHEFDRVPQNPFAMFGGGPGQPGVGGQAGLPAGPFGALLQQMMGGIMMHPAHAHGHPQQQAQRSASSPPTPSSAAEAAAQAAERRAGGGASPGPSGASTHQSSSSGTHRSGSTTVIWNSSTNSYEREPSRAQSPQETAHAPVRNLASFLSDAFRTPPAQAESGPTSPLQEGAAQQGQPFAGGDPLAQFLAQLAGNMGVPLGAQGPEAGPPDREGQQAGAAPAGPSNQPRAARVIIGNPATGTGGVMTFTFGAGPGGPETEGGAMPGFPFMPFMMGNGQGGVPGQAGDYVFSQGALDNIITELMNQANGRYGPQPASEETIKELPKVKMTKELVADDAIQDCAVCKENFEEEEMASKLPCNHLFHCDCIEPWLQRSGTCPVCRYQLVEQPEPPRAPGEPSPATQAGSETPRSPTSPNTARSPPIEGGSTMPGSFPFGQIFSSIGNFFGGSSSGTAAGGSSTGQQQTGSMSGSSRQQGSNQTREEPQGQPDMDLDLD